MSALVTACALLIGATFLVAIEQPWIGMDLVPRGGGVIAREAEGPAAAIPPGSRIVAVAGIRLEAQDVIEEPDMIPTYAEARRFYLRQENMARALREAWAEVRFVPPGGTRIVPIRIAPQPTRPVATLPFLFWLQILTATGCALIGGWVFSLKRGETGPGLLAVAGLSCMVLIYPAAIYSGRELALPRDLFVALAAIDHLGAFVLAGALATLFYVYPARVLPRGLFAAVPMVLAAWWVLDTAHLVFAGPPMGFHLPMILIMACFVPAAAIQLRRAESDPVALAALRWFAFAVLVGASSFVALIIGPSLFGIPPSVSQGSSFVLILGIFVGVAVGVARYRLFALQDRAFDLLYYLFGVLLLLAVDALLISLIALERYAAFSTALFIVALLYLPLRDRVARVIGREQVIDRNALYRRVVDTALLAEPERQAESWRAIMVEVFRPLAAEPLGDVVEDGGHALDGPRILDGGVAMAVPAPGGGAIRLSHAHSGRRLFSPRDLSLAGELAQILQHTAESRDAREQGASEERRRIMRDMHDNIGSQLLSALRSGDTARKDTIISDALSDLRTLINAGGGSSLPFDAVLADLRIECAERLDDAGLLLDWQSEPMDGVALPGATIHELRSVVREAVTNTIRHAGASRLTVRLARDDGDIVLSISDDGRCASLAGGYGHGEKRGKGLANMRTRLETVGGRLAILAADSLELNARVPFAMGPTHADHSDR